MSERPSDWPICRHGVHPSYACSNEICRLERERDEAREILTKALGLLPHGLDASTCEACAIQKSARALLARIDARTPE